MDRKTVYRFRNGSHMYGLATPKSDVDYMEVFLPTPEDVLGLKAVDIVDASTKSSGAGRRNTADDVDDARYTLQSYLQLLLANNPNILETLFTPTDVMVVCDPVMMPLLEHPERVVCKRSYKSFGGYAKSQEHKLTEKRARYTELCTATKMLEISFKAEIEDPKAAMDAGLADLLNKTLKHYRGTKQHDESFHVGLPMKVIYEKMKEERDTYGWRVKTDTFETLGYDTKFASHLVRLYFEAEELLETGRISFPFMGKTRDTIMKVKLGGMKLDELMKLVESLRVRVDTAYAATTLPEEPDREYLNTYLVSTMLEYFQKPKVY